MSWAPRSEFQSLADVILADGDRIMGMAVDDEAVSAPGHQSDAKGSVGARMTRTGAKNAIST
jgi:hypothetical protein